MVWKVTTNNNPFAQINASPVVIGNEVVLGTASFEVAVRSSTYTFQGSIGAWNTSTGRQIWNFVVTPNNGTSGPGEGVWATPAVDTRLGLLYIGTGQNLAPPAGPLEDSLLALNYHTGQVVWSFQGTSDDIFSAGYPGGHDYDFGASPNLFSVHGREIVGDGEKSGTYFALDARTGKVVWKTNLSPGGSFGGILGSAAYTEGRLIVPANIGNETPKASKVIALNPDTGRVEWSHDLPGHILSPVTAASGFALVGTDAQDDYALRTSDGASLWTYSAPAPVGGGAAIVGNYVIWGYGFTLFNGPGKGGVICFSPN